MAESEIYVRGRGSALLIHPEYRDQVTKEWFDHTYWGADAVLVGSGGRGGAWFINHVPKALVLRSYLRGGLVARLSEASYVFSGENQVRSFREFRLLSRLESLGLPVPAPVAAWYRKVSPLQYQAAIIIERIEGARPLAELTGSMSPADWERLGRVLRRFHDAGVRHADLNCFNILVRKESFFLIDFDKGEIMAAGAASRWKHANLERLARSFRKVAGESAWQGFWGFIMNGYSGSQKV